MSEVKKLFVIYLGANDLNITTVGDDLKKAFDEFVDECENYNCENYLELMADALHSNQYSPGEFSIGVLYYVEDYLNNYDVFKNFINPWSSKLVDKKTFSSDRLFKIIVGYELIEGHDQNLDDWIDIIRDYNHKNDNYNLIVIDSSKFKGELDPKNIQIYQLEYDVIYDERRDWVEISRELDTNWENFVYYDESDDDFESDEDESEE